MTGKPSVRRKARGGRPGGRQRPGRNPEFDDATPIYAQLIMHFRRQIETGLWGVGDNIPTLEDLSRDFGVTRVTVRQALSFLEREGLIASRRGRGTKVLRNPRSNLWFQVPETWDELVSSADRIVGEVLDLGAPRRSPQLPEGGQGTLAPSYFVLRRLLKRDDVPYLIGTSYIDRRIVDEVGEAGLQEMSVYRLLEKSSRHAVAVADQTLTLERADAEAAYLLEVPLNAPLVFILRWALDRAGTMIYQSEGLFRSDFVRVARRLV